MHQFHIEFPKYPLLFFIFLILSFLILKLELPVNYCKHVLHTLYHRNKMFCSVLFILHISISIGSLKIFHKNPIITLCSKTYNLPLVVKRFRKISRILLFSSRFSQYSLQILKFNSEHLVFQFLENSQYIYFQYPYPMLILFTFKCLKGH